jgi:hypothetical protein
MKRHLDPRTPSRRFASKLERFFPGFGVSGSDHAFFAEARRFSPVLPTPRIGWPAPGVAWRVDRAHVDVTGGRQHTSRRAAVQVVTQHRAAIAATGVSSTQTSVAPRSVAARVRKSSQTHRNQTRPGTSAAGFQSIHHPRRDAHRRRSSRGEKAENREWKIDVVYSPSAGSGGSSTP